MILRYPAHLKVLFYLWRGLITTLGIGDVSIRPIINPTLKHVNVVHSNVRNFECEDCGRSFSIMSNLRDHIEQIHKQHKNQDEIVTSRIFRHKTFHQRDYDI